MTKLTARPARLSAKLRASIDFRVTKGLSIVDACKEAGISRQGFHRAMKKPAVRDYMQEAQRRFVADTEASRALNKARAYEVALNLMLNSKSEAIRARMVEFLASDGRSGVGVNVHINNQVDRGGYEYVRPGARMVDIVAGTTAAPQDSAPDASQAADTDGLLKGHKGSY